MKVIIQRPLESQASSHSRYVNQVFHAQFRGQETRSGWAVLESLEPAHESPTPDMPFLHKGYFDSHLHVTWTGIFKKGLDLRNCRSLRDFELLLLQKTNSAHGNFLRGFGWDESKMGLSLEAFTSTVEELLSVDCPMILYRVCGHSALVNRSLLKKLGLEELSHFVTDKDLKKISERLPQPSAQECEEAFLAAQEELLSYGVSAVGDMSLDETSISCIRSLAEQGKLLIDVMGVFDAGSAPSVESHGPLFVENSLALGPLDRKAHFTVRHWKKYLDGSFGSRTAWLTQPYLDADVFGDSLVETHQLLESAREALLAGFHLSFHTIGDASMDQALELGEKLKRVMESRRLSESSYPLPMTYHRLEHAQLIREEQIAKLQEQGFWSLCLQPHHRVADASFIEKRIGSERAYHWAYRARSLVEAGLSINLGSDSPVDWIDPKLILKAVKEHQNPAERLSVSDALWLYTTGARLDLGLLPGKIAAGSTVFLTEPNL